MSCPACVTRQQEIDNLEQRLAVLRGLVEECPVGDIANAADGGYWSPEPMSETAAEFVARQPGSREGATT